MDDGRTALFPGTFDPFTNGHLDLTRRAARLFDRVIVAVAHSPAKGTLFALEERAEMIRAVTRSIRGVEVVEFSGLVVECARRHRAQVMLRGLRAVSDFEYEFQMALMNRRLSRALEVAFLMPSQEYTYLNSTLVKEVARLGGSVTGLVPKLVEQRLLARLRNVAATTEKNSAPRGPMMPAAQAGARGAGEAYRKILRSPRRGSRRSPAGISGPRQGKR